MTQETFSQDFERLGRHYTGLVHAHGTEPRGAQQTDRATQERRMEILAGIANLSKATIFDFGCGAGHLLSYLKAYHSFQGKYIGCDLTEEILAVAKKNHPEARFTRRDVFADGLDEEIDFALVSGAFNNRISDNWGFLTASLRALYSGVRGGVSFNLLSRYVDYFDDDLYYADPEAVFQFCKEELSPRVALRHDYQIKAGMLPYEFTVYIYRDDSPRRRKKAP
jgi:SAM-dependent methyltransferase